VLLERRRIVGMRKYKKSAISIIQICMCVILLCSCSESNPGKKMLCAVASYSVPGMSCSDTIRPEVQIIEQDDYHRVLFTYANPEVNGEQEQTVWVICQKITRKKFYYYEDFNYSFQGDQAAIDVLKQQNDWGKPLEEQKFSVRKPKFNMFFSTPGIASISDLDRKKISHAIKDNYGYLTTNFNCCDADGSGNELWIFELKKGEAISEHFVIANSKYEVKLLEIVDGIIDPEDLHEFKKNCNWSFN